MCKRLVVSIIGGWVLVAVGVASAGESTTVEDRQENERDYWEVAIIADLNGPYGSKEYNRYVEGAVEWIGEDLQPDLVVSAGDMVAGQRQGLNYRGMWEAFHETVTDELAAADIPLAVTPGNHDASERPEFWRERIEFARQWEARRPGLNFVDDRFYPFHYAFELGPGLFVSLDGTGVGPLDDAQIDWLEQTLHQNDHLEVVVLFSHLPQYPVAQQREREVFGDERLAELKQTYEVDLMVSGHHHAYYPARRGETILLHAHALGSGTRALLGEETPRTRNLAVFRFDETGIIDLEAFEGPEFDRRVDHQQLPEQLGEGDEALRRYDVGNSRE